MRAKIGARGSRLSLWQTSHIIDLLKTAWPELVTEIEVISTTGDRQIGYPLTPARRQRRIHRRTQPRAPQSHHRFRRSQSQRLPVEFTPELMIGAIPARASVADVMISRSGKHLHDLPEGAVVGTSSPRRSAQLLAARPDLRMISIRGNIDTRVRKGARSRRPIQCDSAGARRSGAIGPARRHHGGIATRSDVPAPGQGALAVECRSNDQHISQLLDPINHAQTHFATTAERAFLKGLGGGCSSPVAAYGWFEADELHLRGRVIAPDGSAQVQVHDGAICASVKDAIQLGRMLAEEALSQGAGKLVGAPA